MTTQPNKIVFVTFAKEGIHKYPAAATDPKLATGGWDDVSFLGVPHRHMFHFRVSIEVFHDDRDIEFIQFKRWLERLYGNGELQLDFKSCEMIADDLYHEINAKYPHRWVQIEVSEDGENGAVSTYPAVTNKSNLTGTEYEHHNPDLNGDGVVDVNEAKAHIERMNNQDLLKEIEKLLATQAGVIIESLDRPYSYPGRFPPFMPGIGDITVD
jgi:hypothetical protein